MTDLRVTEQGQEIEVRAGGRKRILGLSPEIQTALSQDPPWSSVGLGEAKTAEKWGSRGVLIGKNIMA